MESLDRTPTPREQLFSLQQHLQSMTVHDNEFYSELSKRIGEEVITADDTDYLATVAEIYNKDFVVTTRDDDGEVIAEQNLLQVMKGKFAELQTKIDAALTHPDNFGALIMFLEAEQRKIHDDALIEVVLENSDTELEGNVDVLTDWYDDILNQTIRLVDSIYQEPEFAV
jgi:hypothetical protein